MVWIGGARKRFRSRAWCRFASFGLQFGEITVEEHLFRLATLGLAAGRSGNGALWHELHLVRRQAESVDDDLANLFDESLGPAGERLGADDELLSAVHIDAEGDDVSAAHAL